MSGSIFLTGATGFLGSRIARRLVDRGREVHALVRASSEVGELERLGVHRHAGDLTDRDSVLAALANAREAAADGELDVIHCGALISYRTRDREAMHRVNVGGTSHALDGAREAGARRFLHVSSVVAVGHAERGEPLDERSPYNGAPLRVGYVDTKRAAEELVLSAAGELDVVVANPGAIFGPADARSNSAYFLRRMAAGSFLVAPPGSVGVLGVEDAAEGCLLALEKGRRGERYLLVESNLSFRELMDEVATLCGARRPRGAVPRPLWTLAATAASVADRLLALDRLTPESMRMVAAHNRFDGGKARRDLGWAPAPFREVLRETLEKMDLSHGDSSRAAGQ